MFGASSTCAESAVTKLRCNVKILVCDVTFTRNYNYYYGMQDVGGMSVGSVEECADACTADPGCNIAAFFTADPPGGQVSCYPCCYCC
jgi:hypothetical protein